MIAVTSVHPTTPSESPPIVLVHGAANSAVVWTYWQKALADLGWESHAVDLRGHGKSEPIDLSSTSMADYADDIHGVIAGLDSKPVVMGWSMGGLVAMMVAASGHAVACVALAPSTPTRTRDANVPLRSSTFGADFYGITSSDPDDQPAMPDLDREERVIALSSLGPESQYARDDRKAGIVIESLPCPLLIVTAEYDKVWPPEKYDGLWLDHESIHLETSDAQPAGHWGLVLNRGAIGKMVGDVVGWLERS